MFTNTKKYRFGSLVMTGLADVDGFKNCIQVSVWLGFRPMLPATPTKASKETATNFVMLPLSIL